MKKQKLLTRIFLLSLTLAIPVAGGIYTNSSNATSSTDGSYSEVVSITNSSFNANTSSAYYSNDITGWTRHFGDGRATTMVIDTEKNYSSNYATTYRLKKDDPVNDGKYIEMSNPGNVGGSDDNKILMINAALKENQTTAQAHEGYDSSSYTLEANSYYYIKVAMKTAASNSSKEFGSIYIDGLENKNGEEVALGFEKQTVSDWTDYSFYIATGDESQTINISLWLGTKSEDSHGVAFFDQVVVNKYSENLFYEIIDDTNSTFFDVDIPVYEQKNVTNNIKYIYFDDYVESTEFVNHNFNFESTASGYMPKWTVGSDSTSNGKSRIINMTKEAFETATGYDFPGSNFGYENTKSLVLWANNEGVSTVESDIADNKEVNILAHGYYKITAQVKTNLTSGSFYIGAEEIDKIYTTYSNINDIEDTYTLHSGMSSGISSTSGKFTNGYQTVSFYIEGSNLYDSAVKLKFAIGNSTTSAVGYAIVDNVKVETCSKEEYTSASDKLSFLQSSGSMTISNGYFNFTDNGEDENLKNALTPADFTITKSNNSLKSGIINTYNNKFSQYTDITGITNPAKLSNAPADENEANNIFAFSNQYSGYQSIKTESTIDLSASSYYELSFDYTTYSASAKFTVEVINDDGVVLFYDKDIALQNSWEKYKAQIYTGEAGHSVYVIIHFGTKDENVTGYGFIDNIKLDSSSETSYKACSKQIDLSNFLLNLDPFGNVSSSLSNHSAFSGSLSSGTNGEGGVIIGNGNTVYADQNEEAIDKNQDLPNNVLVIRVGEKSTYTLTSKFDVSVSSDSYYKLTFKLLTNYLPKESDLPSKDDDGNAIEYTYGVSIGMTGFDRITKLQSNSGWTTYSIYFKSTETANANFEFSLISDAEDVYGTAFITDINWSTSDEDTYTLNENSSENGKTIFTTATTVEEEEEEEEETDDEEDTSTTDSDFNWLLIPSLIMAAAVVIAVVGALIRKIKFGKKQLKKPTEEYDRKETLDKNVIKTEAVKQRNAEIKKLEDKVDALNKEIKDLDKAHNDYIKEAREQNGGKVTKAIERQFKIYASKHGKLVESLTLTKETLDAVNAPEYLISLEKKLTQEAIKALKIKNKSKK